MPRARIVFEGLISFLRDEASKQTWLANSSRRMVALPINVPGHGPDHEHQPRLWWRAADRGGKDWFVPPIDITSCRITFEWLDGNGNPLPRGSLTVDPRFDRYVPKYNWFYTSATPANQRPVVNPGFRNLSAAPPRPAVSQIILSEGTLTATPLVSKPKPGAQPGFPEEVRFRRAAPGSYAVGPLYLAEACVLEMDNPRAACLRVTIENAYGQGERTQHLLYPVPGAGAADPASIELLVQNFSRPRAAPVHYGVHFKHFFELLTQGREWLEANASPLGKVPPDEAAEDGHMKAQLPYPVIRVNGSGTSPQNDVSSGPICPPMDDQD